LIGVKSVDCRVASLLANLSIGAVCCVEVFASDRSRSFHRPAAGEAFFRAEKGRKRLAPDRTQAQLLLRLCPALRFASLRDRRTFHAPPVGFLARVQLQPPAQAARHGEEWGLLSASPKPDSRQ